MVYIITRNENWDVIIENDNDLNPTLGASASYRGATVNKNQVFIAGGLGTWGRLSEF